MVYTGSMAVFHRHYRHWSRDDVIRSLQAFEYKYKTVPTVRDTREDMSLPPQSACERLFGSWRNTVTAAGFSINKETDWGKLATKQALIRWWKKHGTAPTMRDVKRAELPSWEACVRHYGGFNEALKAAGIPVAHLGKRHLSPEDCISMLQEFHERTGVRPSARLTFGDALLPGRAECRKHFGSWPNALEAAHIASTTRRWTADNMRDSLITYWKQNRHYPTPTDWDIHDTTTQVPTSAMIIREYGTWKKALESANIHPPKQKQPKKRTRPKPSNRISIPTWLRNYILARDNNTCQNPYCCGTDPRLAIDHIHPVSKGGTNTEDNLQVLCRRCNSKKHALSWTEFLNREQARHDELTQAA